MSGAYADAVARARELAQRFAMSGGGGSDSGAPGSPGGGSGLGNSVPMKRPFEGDEDDDVGGKRLASMPMAGNAASNGDAGGMDSKRAAAAAVAAQINQKIGASGGPPSAPGGAGSVGGPPVSSVGPQASIPSLMPTGASAGGGPPPPQGPRPGLGSQMTIVHSVPDRYVGLIIGKGGEQISRIQSETACKVQIAPDAGGSTERSVTLTGTSEQVDKVKDILRDIISRAEKTTTQFDPTQLPHGQTYTVIGVPGPKVGLIIGKSGETIKHLQEEAGVKMVMIQDSNMPSANEKPLRITGEPSRVEKAKRMVVDLLNSKGDRPVPRAPRPPPGHGGPNRQSTSYAVPSEKAGLVIGKGGETIKNICGSTGAWVEIQRHAPHDPNIKVFDISGTQEQIDSAIRMICERVGTQPPPPMASGPPGPHNGPHGYGGNAGGPPGYPNAGGGYGGPPGSGHPYGPPGGHHPPGQSGGPPQQPWGGSWDQHGSQQSGYGGPPHQPYGGPPQGYPYSGGPQQPRPPAPSGPSGYPGAPTGPRPAQPAQNQSNMPPPTINPSTGQPDYSAAWIQYYQTLGMHDQANAVMNQAAQQQQAASGSVPPSQSDANKPPGAPTSSAYSGYGGPQSSTSAPTNPTTSSNASNSASGGQDYAAQWQQYSQQWQAWQQWQEWQQQQQQQQQPKN